MTYNKRNTCKCPT